MYNYSSHYLMERFERAISNNQIDIIKEILSNNKTFLNSHNKEGLYPIHIAVKNNSIEVLDLLLSLGDDINRNATHYYIGISTPLCIACEKNNIDLVKYLVEHGADISFKSPLGYMDTVLKFACEKNNIDIVKYLVEHGAKLYFEAPLGDMDTVLRYSVHNIEISKYLIEKGALNFQNNSLYLVNAITGNAIEFIKLIFELNIPLQNTSFLLHKACTSGKLDIVKLFINKGFDINNEDYYGVTPLINACRSGNLELVKLLIDNGANPFTKSSIYNYCLNNNDILSFFLSKSIPFENNLLFVQNKLLIENILETGLNPNILGKDGISLLLFSFYTKNIKITELLLKYGADINIKNYTNKNNNLNGNTVLIQAVRKRFDIKIINYLLEKGADVNLSNNNGETPLHTICIRITKTNSKQDIEILETLLRYGADIRAKTTNEIKTKYYTFPKGSTPLDIIKIKNARAIENILKNHLSKL